LKLNILITGGSGFIGTSLARRLLSAGHKVTSLDTCPPKIDIDYIEADITNPKLKEAKFWEGMDVCYHLAAMANVDDCRAYKDKAFSVNLYGTFNVAEACRRYNIKMIFASTACVYGDTPQHPSTEDGPTHPMDLYGVTKLAGEEIIKLLSRWVILRFGTTVGPEMRSALATWVFLNQAHNNEPFTITGNGSQCRNWIYVEDLVEGCYKALKAENQIFNLVGRKSYTIYEMAEMCAEIVNGTAKNMRVKYIPAREGDVMKEDISIEKAKQILDWQPKTSLKEALKKSYKKAFQ
jgi:nucleoside-diphosphate-sugar epimerase